MQGPATVYLGGLWLAVVSCCRLWRAVTGCPWLPLAAAVWHRQWFCLGLLWQAMAGGQSPLPPILCAPNRHIARQKRSCAITRRRAIELGARFLTRPNPAPEALPGATARIERRGRSRLGRFANAMGVNNFQMSSPSTRGLVAMTSAQHAEDRQFDPGRVYGQCA